MTLCVPTHCKGPLSFPNTEARYARSSGYVKPKFSLWALCERYSAAIFRGWKAVPTESLFQNEDCWCKNYQPLKYSKCLIRRRVATLWRNLPVFSKEIICKALTDAERPGYVPTQSVGTRKAFFSLASICIVNYIQKIRNYLWFKSMNPSG